MTPSRAAQEKSISPRAEDDGCAFMGTFMGVDQQCDEPPYSDWHDPSHAAFKHEYEHDCGDCVEAAAATPSLDVERLREALTMVGDAIDGSLNDIGLGTPDRLERASIRLATAWNRAHAMAWPEQEAPYEGDARLDEGSATPDQPA